MPVSEDKHAALASLFQTAVVVQSCDITDFQSSLGPREREAARSMVQKRIAEFSSGRHCARLAAAQLALTPKQQTQICDIAIGSSRQPLWPEGVIGSITHDDARAIVVLSVDPTCAGVGIDLQSFAERQSMSELHGIIGSKTEVRAAVDQLSRSTAYTDVVQNEGLDTASAVVFSIKEAVFKCFFPIFGIWIDFTDVTIDLACHEVDGFSCHAMRPCIVGSYTVRFSQPIASRMTTLEQLYFRGHYLLTQESVVSTAELIQP